MIVVEASAMVDALVGDPPDVELLALISDEGLHAPALLDFEVASALRGHVRGGKLAAARLTGAVEDFAALHVERHQMTELLRHILRLRNDFTVYDAAYVVLAQALGAPLITADSKLCEARRLGVDVRVVGAGSPLGAGAAPVVRRAERQDQDG